jgi:hypothetical protein
MKLALMSVELLRGQLVIPVSDRVPQLNVEVTCKATEATDKAMGLAEAQSFTDCMRDESTAQQQLNSIWPTSSGSVRDRCEMEATVDTDQAMLIFSPVCRWRIW